MHFRLGADGIFFGVNMAVRRDVLFAAGGFNPEIFGDRWSPLIIRELCSGGKTFGEFLNGLPLISRTMLVQRLRELADAGVVQIDDKAKGRGHFYTLTAAGEAFRPIVGDAAQHRVRGDAEACGAMQDRTIEPCDLGALGIGEDAVREEKNLRYMRGLDTAVAEARKGSAQIAFLLKATPLEQVAEGYRAMDERRAIKTLLQP